MSIGSIVARQMRGRRNIVPAYIPSGVTSVFFGDSITVGGFPGRWTTRVSTAKGWTEDNRGVSGMIGTEFAMNTPCSRQYFDNNNIPIYISNTHAYLFLAFGVNDVGVNVAEVTTATYSASLQHHINVAFGRGWPIGAIVLNTPTWNYGYTAWIGDCGVTTAWDETRLDAFAAANINVAVQNGCKSINIYDQMKSYANRTDLLAGDTFHVHPNEAVGHLFIANYVISQFQ